MAKRLIISREAYLHIDRIVEFNNLKNHSDIYARKFLKKLSGQWKLLKKFPLMGIDTGIDNIFLLVWDDYYIYYVVTGNLIEIKTIYHQKEDVNR
jgi:plasmid stabilization system protein ParE